MDNFINDLTPDNIDQFILPPPSRIFRVYFHSQTKDILAISKSPRDDYDTFIEVDASKINHFLTGTDDFNNFRVVLNASKQFEIVSKIISNDPRTSSLIDILPTVNPTSLTIVNDIANKQWKFILAPDEQERLAGNIINYTMELFITGNTKNNLHRVLTVDLNKLVATGIITVPHEQDIESLPNKIRLSTVKFFESYALRNDYESKV
jgi:hypothetical protein